MPRIPSKVYVTCLHVVSIRYLLHIDSHRAASGLIILFFPPAKPESIFSFLYGCHYDSVEQEIKLLTRACEQYFNLCTRFSGLELAE